MKIVRPGALLIFALAVVPLSRLVCQAAPTPLQLVEDRRIRGSAEGFGIIQWIAVGPTGRLAIWEPQESRAVIYSAAGKRLGTVGGPGEGPGEFRPAGLGGWIADTLWIADRALRRTTLYAGGLKYLRSEPFPAELRTPDPQAYLGALVPRARYPDGSVLLSANLANGARLPGQTASRGSRSAFVRSTITGTMRSVVAWRDLRLECWQGEVHVPFCADETYGLAPDGALLGFASLVKPDAQGPRFRVTLIGAAGDTVWRREYPYAPMVIPGAEVDSARGALARAITMVPPPLRVLAERIQVPGTYPPLRLMLVGSDGSIWLKRDDGRTWLVLDPKGNPRGTVAVPISLELRQVSQSGAWGVVLDADGVPDVVHVRLQAGSSR